MERLTVELQAAYLQRLLCLWTRPLCAASCKQLSNLLVPGADCHALIASRLHWQLHLCAACQGACMPLSCAASDRPQC